MTQHDTNLDQMEQTAEMQRRRVESTLGELEAKLSPGQLLDEMLGAFQRSGAPGNVRGFADNLGRSVRDNPLPVALVGVGLLWLAAGPEAKARRGARPFAGDDDLELIDDPALAGYSDVDDDLASDRIDLVEEAALALDPHAGESESDLAHRRDRMRARLMRLPERAGESATDLRRRVEDATARTRSRLRSGADRAGAAVSRVLDEQPLLAAAAGVTLGAALAALLPRTGVEDERLAPMRQRFVDEARATGARHLQEADHRAAAAYEAGRDASMSRGTDHAPHEGGQYA